MSGHRNRDTRDFIANVRLAVIAQQPARQEHFDIYANETLFGFSIIKDDIVVLPQDAVVLEVGAGILQLSGYLASLGLRVPIFNQLAMYLIIMRMLDDLYFSERSSIWVTSVLRTLDEAGLLPLFKYFPVRLSPVMYFIVVREPDEE